MSRAAVIGSAALAALLCAPAACSWFEVAEDASGEPGDAAPPATVGRLAVPALGAGDQFGTAVAASPQLIAVGAPGDDREGSEAGAVHLFAADAGGFAEDGVLVAPDARPGDHFGAALALAGGLLAIGAPGRDDDGTSAGAVYVYQQGEGGWHEVATLRAPDAAAGARFGTSVAFVDADRLAIGASGHNGDEAGAGAAYLFRREGEGDGWAPLVE
ncbi:MAG TPA: FG-GAP repeat protein [Kofleriaceae bacterium]|nr:FG-GAP repeat protein [Kofleriaceae bacterium]